MRSAAAIVTRLTPDADPEVGVFTARICELAPYAQSRFDDWAEWVERYAPAGWWSCAIYLGRMDGDVFAGEPCCGSVRDTGHV
mgnify:CR=1 FL=1